MTYPTFAVLGLSGGELLIILAAMMFLGVIAFGIAAAAFFVIRSRRKRPATPFQSTPANPFPAVAAAPPPPERPTPTLAGSRFHQANMTGADFEDVNLSNARLHNVDLSNITVTAAQLGGASFKHIGPPPGPDGKQERQRPVRFEEMMLCDSTFRKVDLSNVRIVDCDLTGMSIDGVAVTDLIEAYQDQNPPGQGPIIRPSDSSR
jgi:hypothetical protein